jgi:hypothetical protein
MEREKARPERALDLGVDGRAGDGAAGAARAGSLGADQLAAGADGVDHGGKQVPRGGLERGVKHLHSGFLVIGCVLWRVPYRGRRGRSRVVGIFRMARRGQAYVGFYWTLPVARAGFRKLPTDVDKAAEGSTTIRYQRDLVRHWVKGEHGRLVHEEVFLEVAPDRGSDTIELALAKAAAICRKEEAALVYVDFGYLRGWRRHEPMQAWLKAQGEIASEALTAEPLGEFDPYDHFERWREEDATWRAGKGGRVEAARVRAETLRATGLSYPKIAAALTTEGLATATGRPWTGESVRKLLG